MRLAPKTATSRDPWHRVAVPIAGLVVFALLVAAYTWATPLGEAPDEPAHLEYLRVLEDNLSPPQVPERPGERSYEFHQPPLAYAAAAVAMGGWPRSSRPELRRSTTFDLGQPPQRYVEGSTPGWWPPRVANAAWALLFVPALWLCATTQRGPHPAAGGATAFLLLLLSPQLVFAFATFSNDTATIALSTLSFALLLRAEAAESRVDFVLAVLVGGLALWAKLTAAFLVFPFLVVGARQFPRRVAALAAGLWTSLLAGLLLYQSSRGIPLGHAVPPTWQLEGGSALALVTEPGWIATLWLGTWAKLGWFNVHLPPSAYLWFLVPTAAMAVGAWVTVRTRGAEGRVGASASLAAVVGAVVLLLVYMVRADWQPQGRLLLPAIGPACVLASRGFAQVGSNAGRLRVITVGAAVGAAAVCLFGLRALGLVYLPG